MLRDAWEIQYEFRYDHPERRQDICGLCCRRFAGELPVRYDERFVKWIPIVVPLFAIMLAVGAYFILRMVL